MCNLSDTSGNFPWFCFCRNASKIINYFFSLQPGLQNGLLNTCLCEVSRSPKISYTDLEDLVQSKLSLHIVVQFWQPFTMLYLPGGVKVWMYLELFSYLEMVLWAPFLQDAVLLHWNWRELSLCSHLGLDQTPVYLSFGRQHCCPLHSSAWLLLLVTSPVVTNLHVLSASLLYPTLLASLPCHLWSQITLMHSSE